MRTRIALLAISAVALAYSLPVSAAEPLVRFEGGIGIQIVANNALERNIVRGVQPGGRPWAIQKLKVNIKQDGSISASGEGLVLASGEQIGTRGGSTHVAAQLFCGAAGFVSPAAELSVGGDFEIRGTLTPQPPTPCNEPVLLIRNATGGVLGNWFAAGTLKD